MSLGLPVLDGSPSKQVVQLHCLAREVFHNHIFVYLNCSDSLFVDAALIAYPKVDL